MDSDTMAQLIGGSMAGSRTSMVLLPAIGAAPLLLTALGINGVMSFIIGRRIREPGLRRVLGARHGQNVGVHGPGRSAAP